MVVELSLGPLPTPTDYEKGMKVKTWMEESKRLMSLETAKMYQYVGEHREDSEELNHLKNEEIIEDFLKRSKGMILEIMNLGS